MTQTIYRPARRAQYTVVSNAIMNDAALSADALGVLVYLLSRPDDWIIHREQLMGRFSIGRDKFQSIFRELSARGYARLEAVADAESGQLAGKRWVIIEEPEAGNREPENPSLGATEERVSRQSAKPTVGKSGPLLSNDLRPNTETEQKTVSPPPPKGAREGEELPSGEVEVATPVLTPSALERFDSAWSWQYGEDKQGAARALFRLTPEEQEAAIKGIAAHHALVVDRQKPPHAKTYLQNRMWRDVRSGEPANSHAVAGSSANAYQRPDGMWWLKIDSEQLSAWHAWERASSDDRRSKPGCTRPSEWPPGHAHAAPDAADRGREAAA